MSALARSVLFFFVAGLMDIGGGYVMWLCLRERWAWWVGALGALVLVGYGVVPTLQPANFGRVCAAYGGVFVAVSMLWGWRVEGQRPDRWDVIGAALCIKYLNNVIEQDHRAVRRRWRAIQCFRTFHTAERTIEGIEAAPMMAKGQLKRLDGKDAAGRGKFVASLFDVAA